MVTKAQAKPKTDFERWQDYINTSTAGTATTAISSLRWGNTTAT